MKDRKTEDSGRSAARKWVTIRVTEKEKTHLMERADLTGLSVSEYMRRRFFGGTIMSYADVKTVGEPQRIGGLLKHNFETLRQAKAPSGIMEKQEDALRKRVWLIQKIGLALIVKKIKNGKSEKPKSWQADRWRCHAALEQERHSPPPRESGTELGADAMWELAEFRRYAEAVNAVYSSKFPDIPICKRRLQNWIMIHLFIMTTQFDSL